MSAHSRHLSHGFPLHLVKLHVIFLHLITKAFLLQEGYPWRSAGKLWKLVLFSNRVDPGDQTQGPRLAKGLLPAGPLCFLLGL